MISSQLLQFFSQTEIEELILDNNARILQKYLAEKELIPAGNLIEIGFEALDKAPLETIETIYTELQLDGFESARPAMDTYLESVKQYKRNTYAPLPQALLEKLHKKWDFWFEKFGYTKAQKL